MCLQTSMPKFTNSLESRGGCVNRCRKIPFGLENRIANFHENGTGKVYTAASGCRCAGGRIWSVSLTPCHSQNTVLQLPGSQRDPFFTTIKAFAWLINGLMN